MATFKLTLEYDGSEFQGWQTQGGGQRTVQGTLEAALEEIAGKPVRATGAGRTDTGVHAEGQVASVSLPTSLDPQVLRRALNAKLPRDVAVIRAEPSALSFHARYDARGKLYRYQVWNGPVRSPLLERHCQAVSAPLDLDAMGRAAADLVGTHDFRSFQAAGTPIRETVRTLHQLRVRGVSGHRVAFDVAGSGFLRHMVRNLVGTLLQVGKGQRPPSSMGEILAARDRAAAGPTAPARGLTLVRVEY